MKYLLFFVAAISFSCHRNTNPKLESININLCDTIKISLGDSFLKMFQLTDLTLINYDTCPSYTYDIDSTHKILKINDTLRIPIDEGQTIVLMDSLVNEELEDTSENVRYECPGIIYGTNYYLVLKSTKSKGIKYLFIDKINGRTNILSDFPNFSPHNKYVFTYKMIDEIGKPTITWLKFWKVDRLGLLLKDSFKIDVWWVYEPKWISDNEMVTKALYCRNKDASQYLIRIYEESN